MRTLLPYCTFLLLAAGAASAAPDPLFGVAGYAAVDFALPPSANDAGHATAVLPDGRILAAGTVAIPNGGPPMLGIGVARLLANGVLDATFGGGDGRFDISGSPLGAGSTLAGYALAVQGDGKIVVAGTYTGPLALSNDFAVARVLADGSALDTTFSGDGIALVPFDQGGGNLDVASAVQVQTDGRIVVAGSARGAGGDSDMAVIRLLPNGMLDAGFGTSGRVVVAMDLGGDNHDTATALALQSDGKIVLAGSATTSTQGIDSIVVRLLANGAPDASFGTSGIGRSRFGYVSGRDDVARSVAVSELVLNPEASRRIVVAGETQLLSGGSDAALAVLKNDGTLDTAFSGDGRQTLAFNLGGATPDVAYAVLVQSVWKNVSGLPVQTRRIVIGAAAHATLPQPHSHLAFARFLFSGALDTTFGSAGKQHFSADLDGDGAPNSIPLAGIARQGNALVAIATTAMRRIDGSIDNDFVLTRVALDP